MLQRRFAWGCIEVCEVSWRGVDGHVGMYNCSWRGMWDAMLGAVQDDNRIHDILRRKRESMRVGTALNGHRKRDRGGDQVWNGGSEIGNRRARG